MDDKERIADLEKALSSNKADAEQWHRSFIRLVKTIEGFVEERYIYTNHAAAYRKALQNTLKNQGYSEEDATDLILLEMADLFTQEHIKHWNTLGNTLGESELL
jgi:hypothetical protein